MGARQKSAPFFILLKKSKEKIMASKILSINELSPLQREKWLKLGRKNYEYCEQTGQRIADFDKAVYDPQLDAVFLNADERINWYKEERAYGKSATKKKNKAA